MMAKWGAWAGALVALAAGCSTLAGLEKDYHLGACIGSSSATGSAGESGVAMLGECCAPTGALACQGHAQKVRLICASDGKWGANGTCSEGELCDTTAGADQGICKATLAGCEGKTSEDVVCAGADRMKCGVDLLGGDKVEGCLAENEICVAGACVVPPSCAKLPATCGHDNNESCCKSDVVQGGDYNLGNDSAYPATVSDFRLDRFEITVGRFRAFVKAYPASKPKEGAGAHPRIAGSGWRSAWDDRLSADPSTLVRGGMQCPERTWKEPKDATELTDKLPINCITWYEAFAFCAWDGGRLPTEAEWNYAAAGGRDQRTYPWGSTPPKPPPNQDLAVYGCAGGPLGCNLADIAKVGSKSPLGDGKWGQADLAGNLWEWNLDKFVDPYAISPSMPCDDCATLKPATPATPETPQVVRGGCWRCPADNLPSSARAYRDADKFGNDLGARCARNP